MKASDIMTRTVITVDEQAPIAEALRLMLGKAISGLPVVDFNNQLVGIITEGDFLRRAELAMEPPIAPSKKLLFGPWSSAQEYVRTHARTVGSVMTRETLCIAEDTPLSMIVRMMEQGHVKRLPVTKDGKVIGIVSRRDVLQPLSPVVGVPSAGPTTDAGILRRIEQDLAAQPWSARHNITVNVKDGVVALTGTVSGFEQREALQILIQNIAGVCKICDQLLVVNPHLDTAIDTRRTPEMLRQPPKYGAFMSTQELASNESLRDGSRVTIRPLNPNDIGIEREFIMRLSPQSRRFRFLSSFAAPGQQLLERLTKLDEATEAAFVALAVESGAEREVGVARLSAVGDGRAEFAVTVRDDWQHKGLGTLLTKHVIEAARKRGLNALYSVDASENGPMNGFAKALGFWSDVNPQDATEVIHTLQLN